MRIDPVLRLPPFYAPFPAAVHPASGQLSAHTRQWAQARGLADERVRERLAAADMGRLVALTLPGGRIEPLKAFTDLNTWFHALDAQYGDEQPALRGDHERQMRTLTRLTARFSYVLHAPEAALADSDPYVAALGEIRTRLEPYATAQQLTDWISGLITYFQFEHLELAERQAGQIPDLDSYLIYCAAGRAARPSLVAAPIAAGYQVPPDELATAALRAALATASVLVCLDNDLFSAARELRRPGYLHNVLTVLAHARGCDPRDAVEDAVRLRDEIMTIFLALRLKIRRDLSTQAARFADDLGSWIRGQIDWGAATPRNTQAEHPVAIPQLWASKPRTAASNTLPAAAQWWRAAA